MILLLSNLRKYATMVEVITLSRGVVKREVNLWQSVEKSGERLGI